MAKSVFHFGGPAAGLLGSLQTSTRLQRRSAAVLLCNPLGEEASRAHRVYRVLAMQLERQGYASLRFDYRCSGDSAGNEADASLDTWLEDIDLAAEELAQRTGSTRLVLVGVRLGATLAAMASAAGRLRVRHLLLWDPVIDGAGHLRELADTHAAFLRAETDVSRHSAAPTISGAQEYLGMPLVDPLRQQISLINLCALEPLADRTTIMRTRGSDDGRALETAWHGRPGVNFLDIPGGHNWNSDAALNAATVPAEIVRTITTCIEEQSP